MIEVVDTIIEFIISYWIPTALIATVGVYFVFKDKWKKYKNYKRKRCINPFTGIQTD
jgi:hypothetical protein